MHLEAHPTGAPLLPEQTFFSDPAIDRLLAMVMMLAAEVHVARDRMRSLEVQLEKAGVLAAGTLDGYRPDETELERLKLDREAFVAELMHCALGVEASLGATAEVLDRVSRD
jgi:hypothetical protein